MSSYDLDVVLALFFDEVFALALVFVFALACALAIAIYSAASSMLASESAEFLSLLSTVDFKLRASTDPQSKSAKVAILVFIYLN